MIAYLKVKQLAPAVFVVAALLHGAADKALADQTDVAASDMQVTYQTVDIDGTDIFFRAAGPGDAPVVLLLHGFPTSSHMFRDLIPELAKTHRVIAPDYPGFGYSDAPPAEEYDYSFEHVANVMVGLTEAVGAENYVLYMQDFGGPIGARLALKHPERVAGVVIQNATFHAQGWNPDIVGLFAAFWSERSAETEAPIRGFLTADTTKWQFTQGAAEIGRLSPDAWTHAQSGLDRDGADAIMLEYLHDYQTNVAQYPAWQDWLKDHQPPTLITWGRNDPFFTLSGVTALKDLLPEAQVHFFDAGHFALETHALEIGSKIASFLKTQVN